MSVASVGYLGELTTTFTAPSACTTSFTDIYSIRSGSHAWLQRGPVTEGGSCFPSNYKAQRTNFYSGSQCPAGYSGGCKTLGGRVTGGDFFETVTCCPSGYQCNRATSPVNYMTLGCIAPIASTVATVTVVDMDSSITSIKSSITINGAFNAFSIQLRNVIDRSQTTSSLSSSPSSSLISPSLNTSLASSGTQSSGSNGPDPGTIIGIVLGVLFGVAVFAGGALWALFIARRRRKRAEAFEGSSLNPQGKEPSESQPVRLDNHRTRQTIPIQEMEHQQTISELGTGPLMNEVDNRTTHELSSQQRRR